MRYDFRDKEAEVYEPQLTLAEKLAIRHQLNEAQDAAIISTRPPPGGMKHPRDWPNEARVWMHRAGIDNDAIAKIGAYWHAKLQRVIVPMQLLDGRTTWIGRDVGLLADPKAPKYLLPQGMPKGVGARAPSPGSAFPKSYVLTEDYLSAWRVSQDVPGATGIALLGTSLGRDSLILLLNLILREDARVMTWLDPDEWGQKGARRIRADLANVGIHAANIVSEVDPKALDPRDLRRFVEDVAWQT